MDFNAELPLYVRYRQMRSGPNGSRGTRTSAGAGKIKKKRPPASQPVPAASLAAWGYVFQIGTQTIAQGSNVTFSNNGPLNGIEHTPGSATIVVGQNGTYNITFSIYTSQNNPQGWAIVINGMDQSEFTSAGQTITSSTTLALNAGDRITIRNVNTIPDPANLRTGDATTAYVLIYKVD